MQEFEGKNRKKNQMPCNKAARARYEKKNYKLQTIKFKNSEMEDIEMYCEDNGIPKNTLVRRVVMQYIGKPID